MSIDVACLGQPFLDVRISGLDRLPEPGEELTGTDAALIPGGGATHAIACSQLGLDAVLLAPRPGDAAGELLSELVARAGVRWEGPASERCAITVAVPLAGERAMITYHPGPGCDPGEAIPLEPAAVVCDIELLNKPLPFRVYGVLGDEQAVRLGEDAWRRHARHAHAVVVNAREARALTGCADPAEAAAALAEVCGTAVVTLASRGAVGCEEGELESVAAPAVAVTDPTGAGDFFVAAYVWAEARGLTLRERLEQACDYASRSAAQTGTVPR